MPPRKQNKKKEEKTKSGKSTKVLKSIKKKEENLQEENETEYSTIEYKNDYREIMSTYNSKNNESNPHMTSYEATLIIGKRATAIAHGAEPVIDYELTETPDIIAIRELVSKKTPYIVKRQLGNKIEYWKIKDMLLDEEVISIYYD
jgi:DNA-directed RNA polymerase subunit K/omega